MEKRIISAIEVAKLANVSQSTVSRVFTPGASVSEKTRKKVMKAAEELNYQPNALARYCRGDAP
ncbi:LacI family DNA-binding transcriptional regulator [Terribacillus sp. 179-K 1B1 HS]|uniref:LacI family DNA-binding transcriptional regulator n=1 Tax=Terribacillus sp. 179-K 1B1 HS TaxID=3142388 RepID=UPI0039A08945